MSVLRLLLLNSLLLSCLVSANPVRWLVVELQTFNVEQSCLSDICKNPKIQQTLKVDTNVISSSIQLDATPQNGIFDRIVSSPIITSHLDSFAIQSEISGKDPTFHFPRACDSSPLTALNKIFNHTIHEKDSAEIILQGKCFKAKLRISVHVKTCPWCVIEQSSMIIDEEVGLPIISSSTLLIIGCAFSTAVALFAIVAFVCTCKLNRELQTKLRRLDTSSSPSTQDTESHYDLPWKNYACRTRMVSVPYTPTKPLENLVCVSPSDHSDQSPFGVCLGTTHLYNTGRDERYVAIRNATCEDSGRDSI
ncbi:hypothetical protein M3Y97_00804100 [Aphelenchoides bicaudatus]|nr:hypothetical protein M3Y97_00804100 [Aphelenchoides bicaudatus]